VIDSPCVKICQLSEDGSLCIGCFRTLHEIAAWPEASDEAKRAIIEAAMERKVTWFDSPEAAEEADRLRYASLTPQERLDEMVALLNRWGKWNERRLERVARFVEVPRS
jgi:predicted Fe-S protein YdhL (DUF1289 family)